MKSRRHFLFAIIWAFSVWTVPAAVLYVDVNATNPVLPYSDWTTAAATIQDAVDAASNGDLILVTNGVYQTGGRSSPWDIFNLESQATVDKPVIVQSVNGPEFTAIYGQPYFYYYPYYSLPARRCVYLADGATLSGFTLTYAAAQVANANADGGGAYCETTNSIITNCIVTGTSATGRGGGIYGGTVVDSVVSYNGAGDLGGGAFNATLIRCQIGTNSASTGGGGVAGCVLNQCSLAGNTSDSGGAAFQSTLTACVLSQNSASTSGGAVNQCTLSACALFNNSSADAAGAASQSVLNHCTLVYNVATNSAGGAQDSEITNCIVYFNTAPTSANYSSSDLEACCAIPLPAGANNISAAPVLADNFHLNVTSPCIGAGEAGFTFGPDIDGEAWANPPAIGCDEYVAPVNGDLSLQIQSDLTKVFVGTNVNFVSLINGHASSNRWDFGDGTIAANQTATAHSWAATGDYVVEFRAFNDTYPNGVSATLLIHVGGLTNYVSLAGTNPVSPYLSWATAATNIQDAVDVSPQGATVLVSNGVYAVGGRGLTSLTNRVLVTDQVAVKSVNGPSVTTIVGNQVPGTINDFGAVRCVYLADGASLSGFTITNGATQPGDDDGVYESYGGGVACAAISSTVTNCIIINNSAGDAGGGASGGTFYNCAFIGNFTTPDGYSAGGGATGGVLNNCSLTGNSSDYGGGAGYESALNNCILTDNWAAYGGAAGGSTLNNCALYENSAAISGGGAEGSTLNNCTLTANWAGDTGGGADGSTLGNCIIFYNAAPGSPNYSGSTLNYCAATPYSGGTSNITTEPQLADAAHVSSGSPCIGAGSTNYSSGVDIDGEAWRNPPSIGCDEFYSGAITGALGVAIEADYTNVAAGFMADFDAEISGHASTSIWNFGDGATATNRLSVSHRWLAPGDYPLVLTAFNDGNPGGISATVTVHVAAQMVHYVSLASTNPVAPYLSWATAATNIQDAINTAYVPGALVLVSNGVYATGGRIVFGALTNRVVIGKPLTVQSVNGPAVTTIQGFQDTNSVAGDDAVRCVYLTNNAALIGFTLTQGATRNNGDGVQEQSGGGAFCGSPGAVLSNCVLNANFAVIAGGGVYGGTLNGCILSSNSAGQTWNSSGGGASSATLNNCLLSGNSAGYAGGGADVSTLNNCTVVYNSAGLGGGVSSSTCLNCIIYYNSGGNFTAGETDYCCTTPLPDDNIDDGDEGTNGDDWLGPDIGTNNVTGEPLFVNAAAGDFHLLAASPCVNAGKNSYAPPGSDFDGNPRIIGDAVDIGIYEFQTVVPFSVAVRADATNAVAGFPLYFTTSTIGGPASNSHWDFGDGNSTNDLLLLSHSWVAPGDYAVAYTAFNEANPGGLTATVTVHIVTSSIHYVALDSTNPIAPYLSWATAATNIQDAVNMAVIGGTVLVTNGIYNGGGRVVYGVLTNRVAVTRPMTVISVNGPAVTTIQGWQIPGTTNGDSAVRCVYLTNGAALSGFTLTNGATLDGTGDATINYGGGLFCESFGATASNCIVTGCSASDAAGGVQNGALNNCVIAGCSAANGGGGVNGGGLNNCVLTGNRCINGAGANGCVLTNCVLVGNSGGYGGGARLSLLVNCALYGNSATDNGNGAGGGTLSCNLYNCTLHDNHADTGGGACEYWWNWWWSPTFIYNSALYNNSAFGAGGGGSGCTFFNCTITGNSAGSTGGGVDGCSLLNSIAYYNHAPNGTNFNGGALSGINYSCTTPDPGGDSNILTEPLLADAAHLAAGSPCIGAGSTNFSSGVDIDGQPWLVPPSIGCDEFYSGASTGALAVAIVVDYTNAIAGYTLNFTGIISGHANSNVWNFGDGTIVTNQLYPSHSFAAGDYAVVFTAFNDSNPGGVSATQIVHALVSPVSYVAITSTNPVPPYLSWATAATNIQDAVDFGYVGGTVLVSNGIYQTGGRVVSGSLTNRVVVVKPLLVSSVNGPAVTTIQGNPALGDSAVRCAYIGNGSMLAGFTLAGGATQTAGDVNSQQSGGGVWCSDAGIIISNCVLFGNSAAIGGGAFQGTLMNCVFTGNSATNGGGAANAMLDNCAFAGNSAFVNGGGAENCTLNNCTLANNSAVSTGGGADNCNLNNCIIYFNTGNILLGQPNYSSSSLNYCCTLPAAGGTGNFTNAPQLMDYAHIATSSPCLGAGSTNYSSGTDIDGEAWRNPPSVGCDEFYAGAFSGALAVTIQADYTNVAPGYAVNFTGQIFGHASTSRWNFGDGATITNQLLTAHSFSAVGNYPVILTAFNGSNPGGISATVTVHVASQTVSYASLASPNPTAPYLSWATAATNIQDAVDAAVVGGTVLVGDGTYQLGGRIVAGGESNRVAVTKPLTLASVNGPLVTTILGGPAQWWANGMRCVYLARNTVLSGFTLTQGSTIPGPEFFEWALSVQESCGGGVYCEDNSSVISNCVVTGNNAGNGAGGVYQGTVNNSIIANNTGTYFWDDYTSFPNRDYGGSGGGVVGSVLNNCLVSGNLGGSSGGGALNSTLNNCTVVNNYCAYSGGGVNGSTLNNCIVIYNGVLLYTVVVNYADSSMNYCCTTLDPGGSFYSSPPPGMGNIVGDPIFVNPANGNYRLQTNSPCINAGNNSFALGSIDLDGRPRIIGGTVDIGAYEFQAPGLGEFIGWLQQYGLPTDGSADFADSDGDGLNNWQEWRAGTNPTNALSVLLIKSPAHASNVSGVTVTWQSVTGVNYFLQRGTNLAAQPAFSTIQTNIAGQAGTTSSTDTTATNGSSYFYRVGVQ